MSLAVRQCVDQRLCVTIGGWQVKLLLLHCVGEVGKEYDLSEFAVENVIVASFK